MPLITGIDPSRFNAAQLGRIMYEATWWVPNPDPLPGKPAFENTEEQFRQNTINFAQQVIDRMVAEGILQVETYSPTCDGLYSPEARR